MDVPSTKFELSATHSHILHFHYTIITHRFNWRWISMRELCSAHRKQHDTNFLEEPTFHRRCRCVLVYPMNGIWLSYWLTNWLAGWILRHHFHVTVTAKQSASLTPSSQAGEHAFCVEVRSFLCFFLYSISTRLWSILTTWIYTHTHTHTHT
jgi:hypothetical protein